MTLRFLFLSIVLWCSSLTAQTCNGLSTITLASSNQCLSNNPILKVSGAKYASKIEWYNGTNLINTTNIKTDNTVGKTVAGGNGSGAQLNQLSWPWGVVVDPKDDSIYVSDYKNNRVIKWKEGGVRGNIFSGVTGQTGGIPQLQGYFNHPTGLFLSASGSLYVSDFDHHKIQKFVSGSRTSVQVAGNQSSGSTTSSITSPFGVFASADSNVYIADANAGIPILNPTIPTFGDRIMKWAPNASVGTLVAGSVGVYGNSPNDLYYPTGVYVNSNGDIYVADFANSRIQKWLKGATSGVTVANLSTIGTGKSAVFPSFIWVDENTNTMYITASNQICDWEFGQFAGKDNYVIQWGIEGSNNYTIINSGTAAGNKFYTPSSLFLTPNGSIYVVDRGNNRVQAWTKSIDTTFTPTTYGNYTAKVYNTGGCSVISNVVPIDSNYSPSVNISSNPTGVICSSANVTFTATPKVGAVTPSYQWTKGGTNISGATNSTYSYLPTNGDQIACVMSVNNTCKTNATATSTAITETVIANMPPSVSIVSSSLNNTFCSGASVKFTATPINGGTNPTYQWMVNGSNITGANSDIFTSTTLKTDDIVTCQLTRTSGGCSNNPVTSSITVKINQSSTSSTNLGICSSQLPYTWNGLTFISAGTQTAHLTNSVGCDSAATLVLTVKATSTSSTNLSICSSQLPYTWNGLTFISAGTQTAHLTNSVGCDSAATLVLTVKATSTSSTNISICPSQLPYTWNGLTFITAGTQTAHLNNSVGCDSAATLVLTVKATSTSNTNISICPSQLPYTWNGLTFITAGTQTAHLINSVGCDSAATLVLTVKATSTSNTNLSICSSQLPYTWNGLSFNSGGIQTAHLTNSVGCDSAATLNLTVNQASSSITNISICSSSNYIFNGTSYTTTGTYIAHLTNSKGCDSTATLNLVVKSTSTSSTNASINFGNSYTFNGTTYSTAGTYIVHLLNSVGCDSTAMLILTVIKNTSSTTNASICSGDSYIFNGKAYSIGGTYVEHLSNSAGFDSAATLILTVKSLSTSTTNASICIGGSYLFNGSNYTTAGTYVAHLINSVGCDSAATLNLSIKQSSSSITNAIICKGDVYTFNGVSYSSAGSYVIGLTNAMGCDSIATLNLTIKLPSNSTTNATICAGGTYTFNGIPYTSSGTYVAHLINSVGCDSAATLILSITSIATPSISIVANATSICSGNAVTFTATPTNAGNAPIYQWKVNNINSGINSPTFTTTSLNNNDVVTCVLTPNNQCQTTNTVASVGIKVSVSSSLLPSIVITPSSTSICNGTAVNFTANVSNGGTNPILQWTKNGNNVGNGFLTYSDGALVNGDVIVCNLTSNSTCALLSNVSSNIFKAVVNENPILTSKIITPDCGMVSVDLISAVVSNTAGLTFRFFSDASLNNSLVNPVTLSGVYYLKATNTNGCFTSTSVTVNNFKPLPIVTTKQNSTPCGVKAYNLNNGITSNLNGMMVAFYSDAALSQLASNPVTVPSTYYVKVTNSDGCSSSGSIVVAPFLDLPAIEPIVGSSTLCNQQNTLLTDKTIGGIWSSLNPTIATVDSKGLVAGNSVGVATINYSKTNICGTQSVPKYIYVSGNKVISKIVPNNPDCIHPFFGKIKATTTGNEGPYKFVMNGGVDTLYEPDSAQNLSAGNYKIDVYNANSCLVETVNKQLYLEGNCNAIFLPTAFIPDRGTTNGENKYLRPFGGSNSLLKSIHFRVFNRYGFKVYESQDIYMQGWDGRVNGILQDMGTYIWDVEYTLQSGVTNKNSGYSVLIR